MQLKWVKDERGLRLKVMLLNATFSVKFVDGHGPVSIIYKLGRNNLVVTETPDFDIVAGDAAEQLDLFVAA